MRIHTGVEHTDNECECDPGGVSVPCNSCMPGGVVTSRQSLEIQRVSVVAKVTLYSPG